MIDLLREALNSPAGSFSFVFSIMMLGGLVVFYVTRTMTKIITEHGQFNKRMDKTEDAHEKRMDITETSIDLIKADIVIIKADISELSWEYSSVTDISKKTPLTTTWNN